MENFLIRQAKSPFLLLHFFFPQQEKTSFGTLPMQMCEDSCSHVSGTEHFLLTGKHTAPASSHSGGRGPAPGAAGSRPRGLSAPWEPEPALRGAGWTFGAVSRAEEALGPPCLAGDADRQGSKVAPSPAQVALDKSLYLPGPWLKLGKSLCGP